MSAVCQFCDTDFVGTDGPGGGKFQSPESLAEHVRALWNAERQGGRPYVICTGGEPLLQLDTPAINALHTAGFEVGVETNGTLKAPDGLDWICVSPKADAPLKQTSGNELKLVYPQALARPEHFTGLDFEHFFLQPMDSETQAANIAATAEYCLKNPQWRLSLQTHKLIGPLKQPTACPGAAKTKPMAVSMDTPSALKPPSLAKSSPASSGSKTSPSSQMR